MRLSITLLSLLLSTLVIAQDDVRMSLLFDCSYESGKGILEDLNDECNFGKVISKNSSSVDIYFIGDTDTPGSVKHRFGDNRFSCTLSAQQSRCKTCDRMKSLVDETQGGEKPEIIVIVDPDYAKWIGDCKGSWSIEQADFNEDLDIYKDYFQYYSKVAKKEGKKYHIIFWWPSEAVNPKVTCDAKGDINYGQKVSFSLTTGSSTPIEVQWKYINAEGQEKSLGQSTSQKNAPSRVTEAVRGYMNVCANVPSCGTTPYCYSIQPSEICDVINLEVPIQTDDVSMIKKFKAPTRGNNSGKVYAEWEILQTKGSYTFYFKIPRQCGVSGYTLYVRRLGQGSFDEYTMSAGAQLSSDKNFEIWSVEYKKIEEGGFLESEEFEDGVCEIYIAPTEYDTSIKTTGNASKKKIKVLFQKCA